MIPFNNKPGFGLVEVLLALAVFTMAIGPLLSLQTSRLSATARFSRIIDRITYAHTLLAKAWLQEPKERAEHKLARPATTFTVTTQEPAEGSSLEQLRDVTWQRVAIVWREGNQTRRDTLVRCRYKRQEAAQ